MADEVLRRSGAEPSGCKERALKCQKLEPSDGSVLGQQSLADIEEVVVDSKASSARSNRPRSTVTLSLDDKESGALDASALKGERAVSPAPMGDARFLTKKELRLDGCYSETVNRDGAAVVSSAEASNRPCQEDAPLDEEHAPPSGEGRASNGSRRAATKQPEGVPRHKARLRQSLPRMKSRGSLVVEIWSHLTQRRSFRMTRIFDPRRHGSEPAG